MMSEEYMRIAMKYAEKDNYQKAREYLLKAYELSPNDTAVLSYLANLELYQKNYDEAIRLEYKVIEIIEINQSPTGYIENDIHPYLSLSNILCIAKRYKEAIEISKKALALVGDDNLNLKASLYCRLSIENFDLGDYEESLMYADKSLKIDSDNQYLKELKVNISKLRNSK
ncbi:tetratricopeptide repeat protein [Flavobacterium sp. ACN2]|uniref:tetratricopeptide repeat protein n=1 Tax=Flavobacterium sp. ACN2 TaxID=1975676 RepID=UPI001556FB7F|nr:tetratricopeptide repeat protein [Flavobacterium sp. ACN2]